MQTQLNHLYTAVAERHDAVIHFGDKGLPPIKNNKPWKYVYLVREQDQHAHI
jgi:hypothetical protein